MESSGALPNEIILKVSDEEWVHAVDYQHVPFRCHKFHEHDHLYREFPLNKLESKKESQRGKILRVLLRWGIRAKDKRNIKRELMRMGNPTIIVSKS